MFNLMSQAVKFKHTKITDINNWFLFLFNSWWVMCVQLTVLSLFSTVVQYLDQLRLYCFLSIEVCTRNQWPWIRCQTIYLEHQKRNNWFTSSLKYVKSKLSYVNLCLIVVTPELPSWCMFLPLDWSILIRLSWD